MLMPQPSFESPRVQGPKRVTAQGRRTGNPDSGGKHVRFAETREGRAVKELLGNGGMRTPLGERYVNRMVGAGGAPTSLSMEEAKLLASLRKLDAHCLAIPAAAAGLDFRGAGSALGGYGNGTSRTVDSLLDYGNVSTSGNYSSRRSVEEAALLASLKRLDGKLGGMKDQMFAIGAGAGGAGGGGGRRAQRHDDGQPGLRGGPVRAQPPREPVAAGEDARREPLLGRAGAAAAAAKAAATAECK